MEKPNPADFSVDEKPGEYRLTYRVEGEITWTITATDEADARTQAKAMLENEDFGLELDDVIDIRLDGVRKSPPMYRVTQDGKKMQVSVLSPGDIPRQPDERGF